MTMVVVVLMGVCGCGKTTVGEALAQKLGWPFRDADDFHSDANKRKMSSAIPLTDEDRLPWLSAIHDYITSLLDSSRSAVLTCSALKRWYRDILRHGGTSSASRNPSQDDVSSLPTSSPTSSSKVVFVLLKGRREVLESRLKGRKGHFMPPDLLTSQLAILEEPQADERSVMVDIDAPLPQIVDFISEKLQSEF